MQGTIRVPNKWLVLIGLLWGVVFVGMIGADSAAPNERRIQVWLTPEEALEVARALPPQLDWELLYPKEELERRILLHPYPSGIELSQYRASYDVNDTTAEDVSEKIRLLESMQTETLTVDIAEQVAIELAFVFKLGGAPQRAVDLLESIVANGSLDDDLYLDAALILARSYRQLGQEAQAEQLLRTTIAKLESEIADQDTHYLLWKARWLFYELGLLLESRGEIAAAHGLFSTLIENPVLPQPHEMHLEKRLEADAPAVEGLITLNGQPLGGIHVGLIEVEKIPNGERHGGNPTTGSVSDASGLFKLYDVPPGTYDITVRLPPWVQADLLRFEPARITVESGSTAEANVVYERYLGFQVTANVQDGEIAWPPHEGWSNPSANPAFVELTWEADVQPAGYRIEMSLFGAHHGFGIVADAPRQTWGYAIMIDEQNITLDDIIFDHYGFTIPGSQSSLKLRLDAPVFTRPGGGAIASLSDTEPSFYSLFGIGDPSTTLRFNVIPLNENEEPVFGRKGGYRIPGTRVVETGAAEIKIAPPHPQLTEADQLLIARDYEAAIALYEAALEANPYDEHSLLVLWHLYYYGIDREGTFRNPERSLELGERLIEITKNVETRNVIQGQLERAKASS